MGQVNGESQPTAQTLSSSSSSPPPLTHFSHPHPLYPTPIYNPQAPPQCSACGLKIQSASYTCQPCNFTLHQSCAQLPKRITHVAHGGGCKLSLLTKPIYPGGVFSCDACAHKGFAWSYHCERCSFDLHVTCAAKPLKMRHQAHATCELHLTFKNPYVGSDEFKCDVCGRIGSKQWLYRCSSCGFDIHMDCTSRVVNNNNAHHLMHSASIGSVNYQQPHQPHHMLMHSASTGAINPHQVQAQGQIAQPYHTMNNGVNNPGGVAMGNQPMMNPYGPNNGLGSQLMTSAVDGFMNGVFQGIGQTMVQDFMGSGGGGGGGDGGGGGGGGGGDEYSC